MTFLKPKDLLGKVKVYYVILKFWVSHYYITILYCNSFIFLRNSVDVGKKRISDGNASTIIYCRISHYYRLWRIFDNLSLQVMFATFVFISGLVVKHKSHIIQPKRLKLDFHFGVSFPMLHQFGVWTSG